MAVVNSFRANKKQLIINQMNRSNPILVTGKDKKSDDTYRFNEVYDLLFENVTIYGLSIFNNAEEVEDTIHEVFFKLLKKKQVFESLAQLKSYIFVSIRNKLFNKIRSGSVAKKYIERTMHSSDIYLDSVEDAITQSEIYKEVLALYRKLPPRCKEIFDLHLAGLTVKQISEELNISVNTVKLHKKRALKKLRTNIPPDILMMIIRFI